MPQSRRTPALRHYSAAHLLIASVFGGAPAVCWLLAGNEALRERGPWWPWRPIAIVALLLESAIYVLAFWHGLPVGAAVAVWLVPVLLLCAIAWRRYAGERRRTTPADPQTAVATGWAFCALRVGLTFGVLVLLPS